MSRYLSFESFLFRWAWEPRGHMYATRPTHADVVAIKASFHGDPDLLISYINGVTRSSLGERMWGAVTPVMYPDAVGAVIITPYMLGQDASASDAVTWGQLTRSHIHSGWKPPMLRTEARALIEAGVPGDFAEALVRAGIIADDIGELWASGMPLDYIIAARSAL